MSSWRMLLRSLPLLIVANLSVIGSSSSVTLVENSLSVDYEQDVFKDLHIRALPDGDQTITPGEHPVHSSSIVLGRLKPLPAGGKSGWIQLICMTICLVLVGFALCHEASIYFLGKMPFTSDLSEESASNGIRASYLFWWVCLMMDPSVLIPTSYELSQEMGCSAALSGVYIGAGYLLTPFGSIVAAFLTKRLSMSAVRLITVIGVFSLMAQNLICAFVLDSTEDHGPQTMHLLIFLRILCGLGKVSYACQYIAYNITPRPKRVGLSIATALATNAGLCLGPLLTAVVIHVMGGREVVPSVYTRSAAPLYIMAACWACLGISFILTLPLDLTPLLPDPELQAMGSARSLGSLSAKQRRGVVAHGLAYSTERALTVAAIEAGTAMILETEFGWHTRAIGFSISMVFFTTVLVCAVIMILSHKGIVKDVCGLVTLSTISVFGAFLLFDFENGHALQILLADVMIYPFMYCANGIVDGIVTGVAMPNTWYSLEFYLAAKATCMAFARFLGFPLARFVIDTGGRNFYATGQAVLGLSGLIAVFRIVSILQWNEPDGWILSFRDTPTPPSEPPTEVDKEWQTTKSDMPHKQGTQAVAKAG